MNTKPYLEYIEKMVKTILPDLSDHLEKVEVMSPAIVPAVGNDAIMDGQGGESYGITMSVG